MGRLLLHIYRQLGLPGAGLILMLEGMGVPIPVELPLGIVGLRIASGENRFWEMVLLLWLSTVAGNTLGYALGAYGGRPLALKLMSWFRVREEQWQRLDQWFRRHGLKLIVATRWINWGFAQNMWLCGIAQVPFWRFFLVMALNDFIWAAAWTKVAQGAMQYVRRGSRRLFLQRSTTRVGFYALGLALAVLACYLVIRWFIRSREVRRQRDGNP